jgi:calcium load-activated calcium channel
MVWGALGVVAYAAAAAALAELLAHVMVYGTPEFQRLVRTYQVEAAKHRKAQAQAGAAAGAASASASGGGGGGNTSAAARNAKRAEQAATQAAGELSASRARANLFGMVVMIPAFMMMGRVFGPSAVLGRLPFTPPGWMQGVTHRGLEGDDIREFGAAFVYAIALNGVKVNLSKLLGSGPRKAEAAMAAAANDISKKWAQPTKVK